MADQKQSSVNLSGKQRMKFLNLLLEDILGKRIHSEVEKIDVAEIRSSLDALESQNSEFKVILTQDYSEDYETKYKSKDECNEMLSSIRKELTSAKEKILQLESLLQYQMSRYEELDEEIQRSEGKIRGKLRVELESKVFSRVEVTEKLRQFVTKYEQERTTTKLEILQYRKILEENYKEEYEEEKRQLHLRYQTLEEELDLKKQELDLTYKRKIKQMEVKLQTAAADKTESLKEEIDRYRDILLADESGEVKYSEVLKIGLLEKTETETGQFISSSVMSQVIEETMGGEATDEVQEIFYSK